jgi:hypothetical protein
MVLHAVAMSILLVHDAAGLEVQTGRHYATPEKMPPTIVSELPKQDRERLG